MESADSFFSVTPQPKTAAETSPAGYARHQARVLLGWLPVSEGVHWLQGREFLDASAPTHEARCRQAREIVAARAPGVDQSGLFTPVPAELDGHLDALRQHPASAPIMAGCGAPRWVDLAKICAVQPHVRTDQAIHRVRGIQATDYRALAELTLPQPAEDRVPATFDPQKNAWMISSPNPNLRVVGNFNSQVGPGFLGFGFAVSMVKSYFQIAGVGGRYFLRDGYHRAYGLLAAGIRQVPALVKEYGSWDEVNLPAVGFLPRTAFLGERPPLLVDYLDDAVSAAITAPTTQKIIIVQALELSSLS